MTDASALDHTAGTNAKDESALGDSAPVRIFQGVNSVMGAGYSTAVKGSVDVGTAHSKSGVELCLSSESLSKVLNLDQSASFGFGVFGASEKTKLMESVEQTKFSLSLVVYASHVIGKETSYQYSLEKNAKAPKTDEEKRNFFRAYGDSFISSIEKGSEYYAIFSFLSQTYAEQKSLEVSLSANGIFSGATLGADFQNKIQSAVQNTNVRVSLHQSVIGLKDKSHPDIAGIVEYALKFPSIDVDAPAIISYETTGYEHVPGFGDFQPIARNRDFFIGNGFEKGLCDRMVKVDNLRNALDGLIATYKTYGDFIDPDATAVLGEANRDLDAIKALASRYNADPLGPFAEPPLQSLTHGTPELRCFISSSDSWGKNGGGEFDDVDQSKFIQKLTHLQTIAIRSGVNVDSLTATYEYVNEQNKKDYVTCKHGGDGGSSHAPLVLASGERVVEITGRSGLYVDQLVIRTSEGRTTGGGGEGGGAFSWKASDNQFLLGFRGRSGALLDRIQFLCITFQKARWNP